MTTQQALQRMETDIRLRGLAQSTYKAYARNVSVFLSFCNRPIEELDENDVRRFIEHLIIEKKLAPRTVNQHSASIRFFFAIGLNRFMNYNQIPMMKVPKKLPDVLTRAEVNMLINACLNEKHKAIFLLAYGSGLRTGEIQALKSKDIDSKEMRILVRGGKNKRDHYTVLSKTTLSALRDYWRTYRPNSKDEWIFPGYRNIGHITRAGVAWAFDSALGRTNIQKEVSTHSLRHAFATHLLEDGVELMKIKELLGHYRLSSTMVYLHLANATKGVTSPADVMGTPND